MGFILSIDQGTSSTRSIIIDENGDIKGVSQKEHKQIYPHDAWVEHDPIEIKHSVINTMNNAIQDAKISWKHIKSIGITNQRETVVAWDKNSGNPLSNAIVWQCRRTTPIINQLRIDGYKELFHSKTGLVLDAYFSGTKMKWLQDNVEKVKTVKKAGNLAFGTIDSWIIYFMTGQHTTDASNASRTLLYNLITKKWSPELSEILGIDLITLPIIHENAGDTPFGYYKKEGNRIPIRGVLGDQQAALFGQTGFKEGDIKTTYGTGNFTLLNTGEIPKFSKNGLLTTVAWEFNNKMFYAMEGSVFITGAALSWLKDNLHIFDSYDQIDDLISQTENSGGLIFVPAFVGLGAPYWDASARGLLIGLTRGTSISHIIRATIDSIAFQTEELLSTIKNDTAMNLEKMQVDGGITRSDVLMQRQADISQITINKPRNIETTALGAGFMAGLGEIWETLNDLKELNRTDKSYQPKLKREEISQEMEKWKAAVKRSQNWV